MNIVLTFNMRLQPQDRHDLEDVLDQFLEDENLGEIVGGGTSISKEGEPESCDISIDLNHDDNLEKIIHLLTQMNVVAKGSSYRIGEESSNSFGTLVGVAIYLNGTDLADEVYQENDVNDLISEILDEMGENNRIFSWWDGPRETAFYFYGQELAPLMAVLQEKQQTHPLCEKSRLVVLVE
ncbi:hypothetical protein [Suttonella ornithocola]|uniref:Uncharacterized protein n=1 Tax=Suttonella ornithocola TaxID=279832 RepID=A0A380MTX4_9GAMM|nr:hypothetical protein [Suttonella ornithocola]SUO95644.1 Uncharacterised protein [Suttonella ornithocola]